MKTEEGTAPMAAKFSIPDVVRNPLKAPAAFWAAVVVGVGLAVSYAPNFRILIMTWWEEPNYSHGFLVAPIAAAILWQRRDGLKGLSPRPSVFGWLGLAGMLGLRAYFYEENQIWLENATLLGSVVVLVLALCGWRILWWALPGLLFLGFMLPLPLTVNAALAGPLQSIATVASANLLTTTGLRVVTEGNVIHLGAQPLEVARACNGLSILMSFVTLVTATVILARDFPIWQRVTLLLSTVPIALVSNILRITATAWCYHLFGEKIGNKVAHDTAGFMMMPLALLMVWLEIKILSWLVVEEQIDHRGAMRMTLQPAVAPRVVKK